MLTYLEKENLVMQYDPIKQIACIAFNKMFDMARLGEVYVWLAALCEMGVELQAILVDCRHVRTFSGSQSPTIFVDPSSTRFASLQSLPLALIVDNPYQERKFKGYLQNLNQTLNLRIVQSYLAAFEHIGLTQYIQTVVMLEDALSTDSVSVWVDREQVYCHVIYYGIVTAQTTVDAYRQVIKNLSLFGVENVKAGIFDFRYVSRFDNSNIQTVKRQSSAVNQEYDMRHIAVPLIVGNFHQEQMVRMVLKVSPQEERKRIVKSSAAALQFVHEFHTKLQAQAAQPKE